VKEACRKQEQTHVLGVCVQLSDATRIAMTLFGQILYSPTRTLLVMKVTAVGRSLPRFANCSLFNGS
jgi:hypothetical protein